jgi:hypothetical protein
MVLRSIFNGSIKINFFLKKIKLFSPSPPQRLAFHSRGCARLGSRGGSGRAVWSYLDLIEPASLHKMHIYFSPLSTVGARCGAPYIVCVPFHARPLILRDLVVRWGIISASAFRACRQGAKMKKNHLCFSDGECGLLWAVVGVQNYRVSYLKILLILAQILPLNSRKS